MNINTQYSTPTTTYSAINMKLIKQHNVNYSTSTESITVAEQSASKNTEIWGELAKEYDIRNASFNELSDISTRLYKAGEISLFGHAMLTFDPSKSPQPVKTNIYLTEPSDNGKRDWIAEYEARVAKNLKMGNITGYRVNKNVLKILVRLQQ